MASLDPYLSSVVRFGATGIVLESNANIRLCFPTGDRQANQQISHEQLQQLIGAAAPDAVRMDIISGNEASFPYTYDGKPFTVRVTPFGQVWTVRISQGAAPMSASAAPSVAPTSIEAMGPGPGVAATPPVIRAESSSRAGSQSGLGHTPGSARLAGGGAWLDQLLYRVKEMGASDLHLCTGSRPFIRESGHMQTLDDYPPFQADELLQHIHEIAPETNRLEFEERNDTDFAYNVEGLSRFRVNVFRDRKGPGAVLRAIPFEIPSAEQLGIPETVLDLCKLTKGLVLVTGPTGSGKSTTLAALIDYINNTRHDHIITIEDPIEFVHENKKCLVNQREIGTHTDSFKQALRAALREDPDIVLVGELRDLETIAIAVETAETGHLVFGTLHTSTAPSTVDRVIDQFPPDQQEQIRQMLAESLKGVIAQVLCRRKEKGRVAAYEILIGSSAVSNLIREKKTFQLFSVMQTGRSQGMRTMNDSLIDLVKRGVIEPTEAYMKSVNKTELKSLLTQAGFPVPGA